MTWSRLSRGFGAEPGPTCRAEVNTRLVAGGMDTVDTSSKRGVHIPDGAAIGIDGGHRWAVDVGFRSFDRPPPPLGGLGGERGADVVVGLNRRRAPPHLRKPAVDRPSLPGLEGPHRPDNWRTRWWRTASFMQSGWLVRSSGRSHRRFVLGLRLRVAAGGLFNGRPFRSSMICRVCSSSAAIVSS
jgi:hypothetical protein